MKLLRVPQRKQFLHKLNDLNLFSGPASQSTRSNNNFKRSVPHLESKGKDKAIPVQVWTGLEGCSRLRLADFMKIGT
jgi:hypothetical protein